MMEGSEAMNQPRTVSLHDPDVGIFLPDNGRGPLGWCRWCDDELGDGPEVGGGVVVWGRKPIGRKLDDGQIAAVATWWVIR